MYSVVRKQDLGALANFLCSQATREQHTQMAGLIRSMVPEYEATALPVRRHGVVAAVDSTVDDGGCTSDELLLMGKRATGPSKVAPLPQAYADLTND